MPGMAEEIEGAMQQAPHPERQSIDFIKSLVQIPSTAKTPALTPGHTM
jgi:hypothetical protein